MIFRVGSLRSHSHRRSPVAKGMKIASQALGITAWQGKVTIGKNSEPNLRMFFHLKGFVCEYGLGPTATKFPPIPDRVLYTLRFVQAGFDCHIVPYNAQAATAIRHKAKEAGRSLGEQLRGRRPPASPVPRWPRAGSGPRAGRRPAACDAAARRWFGSGRAKVRLMQRGKSERNP
jgi:hypothetical protein